jgi:hypothetical protein
MTLDNWLTIAAIIIAPTIAEFVKLRMSQPTPSPEANQPKNRIQRIGGWLRHFLASPWILPPFGILCDIGVLVWFLRSSAPVTRGVVVVIASAIVGIVWNALNMNVLFAIKNERILTNTVSKQLDILIKQDKTIGLIIERIDIIERRADPLDATLKPNAKVPGQTAPDKSTVALGRLLAAVKNMLGP